MRYKIFILISLMFFQSCDLLDPKPVDLITNELVLNEANDVNPVEIGLYTSFRGLAAPLIIVNDLTTDLLRHNGTFSEFRELSNKDITSANAIYTTIWGGLYNTIYISNFILERLPEIGGVDPIYRRQVMGTARFFRGFCYFIGASGYGDIPLTQTADIEQNKNIARASKEEVLALALEDLEFALNNLPLEPVNESFLGVNTARAALARFHLYQGNWDLAEKYASDVINSNDYQLVSYEEIVNSEFTNEAIFEVGYTLSDDPGTSTYGLNNLFKKRREIIPTDVAGSYLFSSESQDRSKNVVSDFSLSIGNDNGLSVDLYKTADEDKNNIIIFRLAEMYLIRAEARVQLGRLTGENGGENDINILRTRANSGIMASFTSPAQALLLIERERVYELAFQGHRWFDLVRTGRINAVMINYSPSWRDNYNLWPIPIREIQNNDALKGAQNPGY
jgi:starch-binding outer membrane protein, SusD/RagB family